MNFHAITNMLALIAITMITTIVHADPVLDLTRATILTRGATAGPVETTASQVLVEETNLRTTLNWSVGSDWPTTGWTIAILAGKESTFHGRAIPKSVKVTKAEGYGIATDLSNPEKPILWIDGADGHGTLYGVGRVLRNLECRKGNVTLVAPLNVRSAPQFAIRGHQLGYRANANSYDLWTPQQFDQYIRELALFGSNAVEGIPFQDDRPVLGSTSRRQMNVEISQICKRYGQQYWLWAPADFDLKKTELRSKALKEHADLFRDAPSLAAVFVAGGDPGDNAPDMVIPYLEDLCMSCIEGTSS